ncbi:kinase-like protein [Schizopora paradoxa]|uniref:mitogen-activated protein kinase n=1 Tax=Schizopora paradoxa TaxID=27342 RepID=A0A0H2R9V4_9AGAM|nr:kinase-like protein [Schizopora paradoxa]
MDLTNKLIDLANDYKIRVFEESDFVPDKSTSTGKDGYVNIYEAYEKANPSNKVMIKKFQRIAEATIMGLHSRQGQFVQERMWKYFKRECRVWNCDGIDHPNIIRFLGVMKQPDLQLPVFVTQLASLGNLYMCIVDGRAKTFELHKKMKLMCDVAEGLSFLHKRDVVHRDLKPSNIMLNRDSDGSEKALLGDFGSAKDLQGMLEFEVSTHMATIAYCSPEHLQNPREISSAKDMWSFGCVLAEFVTCTIGLWPPEQRVESVQLSLLRGEHPPRPPSLSETDTIWIFIEACCWCKKPEERVTAKEAASELIQIK